MPSHERHQLDGWDVIVAPERARRPGIRGSSGDRCPFCPGHEEDTPPEIERLDSETHDWDMRLVPNRYPAVDAQGPLRGRHEVLVETPLHDLSPYDFDVSRLQRIVRLYRRRVQEHAESSACTVIFKNCGRAAGETIAHAHSQILSLANDDLARTSHAEPSRETQVRQLGDYALWCPPGSRLAWEMAITPTRSIAFIESDAHAVASLLHDAMMAIAGTAGRVAFNWYVTARRDQPWALTIAPRTSQVAGFELATGWWINVVEAREAAMRLRSALEEKNR